MKLNYTKASLFLLSEVRDHRFRTELRMTRGNSIDSTTMTQNVQSFVTYGITDKAAKQ